MLLLLGAQHAEANSGLAGVRAELREQRDKSSRTSNHKRGPVRAIIAQKKLEEQRLSYTLLQTKAKMSEIQAILQQRAKDAVKSRRQRAIGGRRDMSPGEESSKDSDSNSHHSPGVPCTSALATPGGAAETERKAREKDSEAEWEGEKGEEWKLRVQDRGQGLIKESLLKFGNKLGEGSVKEKNKKKKKKKKNIARRQLETSVRGSGDSMEEGECSNAEFVYNEDDFQALQKPGSRDTNPTGGNTCMPQESAHPASVEVSGPPAALHGDRETIPDGTMASTGDPMEGPFPSSLPSDLPLHVVAPSGVAGSSASCPQAAAGQDGTGGIYPDVAPHSDYVAPHPDNVPSHPGIVAPAPDTVAPHPDYVTQPGTVTPAPGVVALVLLFCPGTVAPAPGTVAPAPGTVAPAPGYVAPQPSIVASAPGVG
ncbi:Hypothetical predicted protein [Pelobates cultripes]|uniref:Uncharacterized protein n=1 Tax=Pelobates cultripes TaxID=61616 RepID=A0AAD1T2L8_PELCU|nr:Hypothetical predicted protein [Pelobates cultripes]